MSSQSYQNAGQTPEEQAVEAESLDQSIQDLYGNSYVAEQVSGKITSGQSASTQGNAGGETGEADETGTGAGGVGSATGGRENDPWWPDMLSVVSRSNRLNLRRKDLEASSPTEAGKLVDPEMEALAQDIMAFGNQCGSVQASWDSMDDAEHGDRVLELEDTADMLEAEMSAYQAHIDDYDKKRAEKLQIIARVVSEIGGKVGTAEGILKRDQETAQRLVAALDNQRRVAQVNVGLGLLSVALSIGPGGIVANGMTALQMAIQPSGTGAVEIGSSLVDSIAGSSKVISHLADGVGNLAGAYGTIQQAIDDRDKYVEIYKKLQAATAKAQGSANSLASLMQQYNDQLGRAQEYASKATGV